jgi:hypothetical protein
LSRDTSSNGGPDSFVIGSVGTSNCVSRFGLQDAVGNVFQWTSDQLGTCSSGSHSCSGITSVLDSGNTDWNGFEFNGTQGPGGGASAWNEWNFNSPPTQGGVTPLYFSAPLGLPLVGTDGGNALQIGGSSAPSISAAKFHGEHFWLYTDNGNDSPVARGSLAGGLWNFGSSSGRFALYLGFTPSSSGSAFGFRCALPAQ